MPSSALNQYSRMCGLLDPNTGSSVQTMEHFVMYRKLCNANLSNMYFNIALYISETYVDIVNMSQSLI